MAIVGQGITAYPQPDDALNENSKNPVQNKVVAGNIKELKGKDTVQDERIAAMEQVTTATTIGPVAFASFDASAANMPLKGLTVNIEPVQSGSGDPSPDNVRPITGLTGCKLHHTGVSLIGGDAFIGYTFSKTATGYQLSYNGSSISNRASANADIRGLPAGRYTIVMLNPSYPEGAEVNIRRNTAGSTVTMGTIISSSAYGRRTYTIPENTTALQLYIIPDTMPLNTSITMSDIVLVREADDDFPEPYNGNVYSITFPSEAGTVYGGTLSINADGSGELTVDAKIAQMDALTWNTETGSVVRFYCRISGMKRAAARSLNIICSCYKANIGGAFNDDFTIYNAAYNELVYLYDSRYTTLAEFLPSLEGQYFVYPLQNPITYKITAEQVTTLLGTNNIWSNRGDVTVTYGAYLETIKELVDKREMREEQVEGTVINLNAEPNTRYICGEVATLDITLPASGTCDIVFTSGSTPTVLTVPSTVKWMHGFDPTALAADTIYELNITDGLGVVASWT